MPDTLKLRLKPSQGWDETEAYARRIASVTKATYRIDPDMAILNVYGDGRVQGRILEV